MHIRYISTLGSAGAIDRLHRLTGRNPGFAMQKFNRLVAEGLARNGATVESVSALPVTGVPGRVFFAGGSERDRGVDYTYLPVIDIPGVRHLTVALLTFISVLLFGLRHGRKGAIVCDMLNLTPVAAALCAARLTGLVSVGILTDLPDELWRTATSRKERLTHRLINAISGSFSRYVFLTEAMNARVNRRRRPYIVMEGLVEAPDAKDTGEEMHFVEESAHKSERNMVYAGGLKRRYGVGYLADAMALLQDFPELRLDLFGSGDMEEELRRMAARDPRIRFHGVVANSGVVDFEKRAWLLVNPRPTHEEFVKYSFPSKNMEYLTTGTPVLTTRLPGMPADYLPYVYLIEEESAAGTAAAIRALLTLPPGELRKKGSEGRHFVLTRKNNVEAGKRIVALIEEGSFKVSLKNQS